MLFTSKVESDEPCSVSFPFTFGFGCGQAIKVAQGQKFSLQTQHKISSQLSGKVSLLGTELGSSVGGEISETLTHEMSANVEWSYTARPCEYCNPQVHFPNARIKILSRRFLNLPLFVTRKTIFVPGEPYEIHAHCRHAPDKCGNCAEAVAPVGNGSVLTAIGSGGPTHLERVVFATRTPANYDLRQFLKEIISAADRESVPEQLYLHEFQGRILAAHHPGEKMFLYSLDDVDRALGAVRLSAGVNRLFFLAKSGERSFGESSFEFVLTSEAGGFPTTLGTISGVINYGQFYLVQVDFSLEHRNTLAEQPELKLFVGVNQNVANEWPAILLLEHT
jgi:hypothetical protein